MLPIMRRLGANAAARERCNDGPKRMLQGQVELPSLERLGANQDNETRSAPGAQ